jgi:hypothetical protein
MAGSDGSCFFFSSSVKSMLGSNSVGAAETVRLTCLTRPENSCLGSQVNLRKYYEVLKYLYNILKIHYLFRTCYWWCGIDQEQNHDSYSSGTSNGEVPAGNGSFSASAKIEVPEPCLSVRFIPAETPSPKN